MSSPIPHGSCFQFLSRRGFSNPTALVEFSWSVANSRSSVFRNSICVHEKVPVNLYEYALGGGTRTYVSRLAVAARLHGAHEVRRLNANSACALRFLSCVCRNPPINEFVRGNNFQDGELLDPRTLAPPPLRSPGREIYLEKETGKQMLRTTRTQDVTRQHFHSLTAVDTKLRL